MRMPRRACAAAFLLVPAGLALAMPAPRANAFTDACQNNQQPVWGPIGCGSLFLPYYGGGPHGYSLTLTGQNSFDTKVTATPINGSARQDWTFWAVCVRPTAYRSPSQPCGSGHVDSGRYVVEYTPFGNQPEGGVNSYNSLCLDDDHGQAVMGFCLTPTSTFSVGFAYPPSSPGVPPVVGSPNPAETWVFKAVKGGYALVNAATHRVLTYAGHGRVVTRAKDAGPDQVWELLGCTAPIPSEAHGWYGCL